MGWDWNLALSPYTERWRHERRAVMAWFNITAAQRLRPIQRDANRVMLLGFLRSPEGYWHHVRRRVFYRAEATS